MTLIINKQEFEGEYVPFENGMGYYFKLSNGEFLKGNYKQGYYGKKVITLAVSFDKNKRIMSMVNNSSRQVKDPYAYLLSI